MSRAKTRLSDKATYVTRGYGQVEGNKLSARYNGKIFASLPCKADITCVENGMFLKYDYAKRMVDLDGPGEWLLAFNEVKVYRDLETDADFAMLAENYDALVYNTTADGVYTHYVPGTGAFADRQLTEYDNVTSMKNGADELQPYGMMNAESRGEGVAVNSIVPRLFKTDVGDIMTTNTIKANVGELAVGDILKIDETDGYLSKDGNSDMQWQVVQVYTMPDLQPGVKLIRVQ